MRLNVWSSRLSERRVGSLISGLLYTFWLVITSHLSVGCEYETPNKTGSFRSKNRLPWLTRSLFLLVSKTLTHVTIIFPVPSEPFHGFEANISCLVFRPDLRFLREHLAHKHISRYTHLSQKECQKSGPCPSCFAKSIAHKEPGCWTSAAQH